MDKTAWDVLIEVLVEAMLVILPIVLTAVGVYVIRYIRKSLREVYAGLAPGRQQALRELFGTMVLAAESMYGKLPGTGEEKKAFVMQMVESWTKDTGLKIPKPMIEAFIEAAVYTEINGPSGIKVKEAVAANAISQSEAFLPAGALPSVIDSLAAAPVANEPAV